MGKKRKITKLVFLFIMYFFPVFFSIPANASCVGSLAEFHKVGSGMGWTSRSDVFPRSSGVGEDGKTFYIITSQNIRYPENQTITAPEGTEFLVVVEVIPLNYTNKTFLILLDGNITEGRMKPELGVHHLEVLEVRKETQDNTTTTYNSTAARWDLSIITQEAWEAQNLKNVEPAGLRRKAALLGALAAAITFPVGMYLRRRSAREEVL